MVNKWMNGQPGMQRWHQNHESPPKKCCRSWSFQDVDLVVDWSPVTILQWGWRQETCLLLSYSSLIHSKNARLKSYSVKIPKMQGSHLRVLCNQNIASLIRFVSIGHRSPQTLQVVKIQVQSHFASLHRPLTFTDWLIEGSPSQLWVIIATSMWMLEWKYHILFSRWAKFELSKWCAMPIDRTGPGMFPKGKDIGKHPDVCHHYPWSHLAVDMSRGWSCIRHEKFLARPETFSVFHQGLWVVETRWNQMNPRPLGAVCGCPKTSSQQKCLQLRIQ
jgi:hypothetical protein